MVSEMTYSSVESAVRKAVMSKISVSVSMNNRSLNMGQYGMMWQGIRYYSTVMCVWGGYAGVIISVSISFCVSVSFSFSFSVSFRVSLTLLAAKVDEGLHVVDDGAGVNKGGGVDKRGVVYDGGLVDNGMGNYFVCNLSRDLYYGLDHRMTGYWMSYREGEGGGGHHSGGGMCQGGGGGRHYSGGVCQGGEGGVCKGGGGVGQEKCGIGFRPGHAQRGHGENSEHSLHCM